MIASLRLGSIALLASCNSRSPFTTFSQGRAIALFDIKRSIALSAQSII
ncbi:hypothetical protein [Microcoleus sp. bin38.metabat.b11b12b14.051]|nr:hypothetical protein [Microcoleus sp. bin38.metabat.b11b12b14.051]